MWPAAVVNEEEVVFGAATHDIGKSLAAQKLYSEGSEHQKLGYDLLILLGVDERMARFALTHVSKNYKALELEDLIVILADKLWKGVRINEPEEAFVSLVSKAAKLDYWAVHQDADSLFSNIILQADGRISWQSEGRGLV